MSNPDLVCVGASFEDLIFEGLERLPRLGEELRTQSFVRTLVEERRSPRWPPPVSVSPPGS